MLGRMHLIIIKHVDFQKIKSVSLNNLTIKT